ncbi:MAG: hypothetical protein JWL73_1755 [Actinomycetia bacterium]|nr:hypothetical protein [Actinomycetes bacterium]
MSRELVVFSHLRWTFVWQRPQHLISRLAHGYDRTWFVEEPEPLEGLREPCLRMEQQGDVTRVWLQVPDDGTLPGFNDDATARYAAALTEVLEPGETTAWLYTPMALAAARSLQPTLLVYDVMDDLGAFRYAAPELALRQRQALREADVVFTGGRSLHRSVMEQAPGNAHCFPSGVEPEHFASAAPERERRAGSRPVAGYVGVIDERLDLDLIRTLAEELSDWTINMVGPVIKIDESTLPSVKNIRYPGPCHYSELPEVMSGFDVALMPFARNEATRSISPTKTLEYLAAGLPVVSTRVPDVVADYSGVVELCDDGVAFARACRSVAAGSATERRERVRPILHAQHWDTIAARMAAHLEAARFDRTSTQETA